MFAAVGFGVVSEYRVLFDKFIGQLNVHLCFSQWGEVITLVVNGGTRKRNLVAGADDKNIVEFFVRIHLVVTAGSHFTRKYITCMGTNNGCHIFCT